MGRKAFAAADLFPRVLSLKFFVKIAEGQKQVLRLTTPKLKSVWGPFRSG
jgi:hypothetical protein